MDKSEVLGESATDKVLTSTKEEEKKKMKEVPTASEGSDEGEEIEDIPDDDDEDEHDEDKSTSKKGEEEKRDKSSPTMPRKAGKKRNRRTLTKEDLRSKFHLTLREAAHELDICITTVKKACRQHGIKRWPRRKLKAIERVSDIRKEQEHVSTTRTPVEGVAMAPGPMMLPQMGGMMMNMGYPQLMMYGGNPAMMMGGGAPNGVVPTVVPQMAQANVFPQTSAGFQAVQAQQQAMYGSFFGFPGMGGQQIMAPQQQHMQPRVAVPAAFYGAPGQPPARPN